VKINITARDIARSRRDNCRKCPIELSLQRTLPRNLKIAVGVRSVRIDLMDYLLPSAAVKFIAVYDSQWSHEALPFAFELDVTP